MAVGSLKKTTTTTTTTKKKQRRAVAAQNGAIRGSFFSPLTAPIFKLRDILRTENLHQSLPWKWIGHYLQNRKGDRYTQTDKLTTVTLAHARWGLTTSCIYGEASSLEWSKKKGNGKQEIRILTRHFTSGSSLLWIKLEVERCKTRCSMRWLFHWPSHRKPMIVYFSTW